jgi:hypothetical protein
MKLWTKNGNYCGSGIYATTEQRLNLLVWVCMSMCCAIVWKLDGPQSPCVKSLNSLVGFLGGIGNFKRWGLVRGL